MFSNSPDCISSLSAFLESSTLYRSPTLIMSLSSRRTNDRSRPDCLAGFPFSSTGTRFTLVTLPSTTFAMTCPESRPSKVVT